MKMTERAADIALCSNRLAGVEYSVCQHQSILVSAPNQAEKWRYARFGCAVSRFLCSEVDSYLGATRRGPTLHLPHGLDFDFLTRDTDYVPWSGKGVCLLFTCGRICHAKGYLELVHMLRVLMDRGLQCQLRVAGSVNPGSDGYFEEVRRRAQEQGVAASICWLGTIGQRQIRQELQSAHVAVAGAGDGSVEGWGSAIAEAMAMGTPTVACRTGGVSDTIDDGENGLLASPGDAVALADAVERLLCDPALAMRISERGAITTRERFALLGGPSILKSLVLASLNRPAPPSATLREHI